MIQIDVPLVQNLICAQFPQWENLPIRPVAVGGWDNRTFHLGETMLVRLPSGEDYATQVEKEQKWLPKLAPYLPLPIPAPLAMGEPGEGYPCRWSIYRWIEGEAAAFTPVPDMNTFAIDLATFLLALQRIDTTGGPRPGPHNFSRGDALATYDGETRQALSLLKGKVDAKAVLELWEKALKPRWSHPPVWVHGDISAGNLLVQEGKLSAVIDFGGIAVGDPSCDLVIAWKFFPKETRAIFKKNLPLDEGTWIRGRGWALWKALIVAAELTESNIVESTSAWRTIEAVLNDTP